MYIRGLLIFITLLPMVIYYLKLSFTPQIMATYFIAGMPASIFWGIVVMLWGVLMAFVYVLYAVRQRQTLPTLNERK